jgi:hypothetical protein
MPVPGLVLVPRENEANEDTGLEMMAFSLYAGLVAVPFLVMAVFAMGVTESR